MLPNSNKQGLKTACPLSRGSASILVGGVVRYLAAACKIGPKAGQSESRTELATQLLSSLTENQLSVCQTAVLIRQMDNRHVQTGRQRPTTDVPDVAACLLTISWAALHHEAVCTHSQTESNTCKVTEAMKPASPRLLINTVRQVSRLAKKDLTQFSSVEGGEGQVKPSVYHNVAMCHHQTQPSELATATSCKHHVTANLYDQLQAADSQTRHACSARLYCYCRLQTRFIIDLIDQHDWLLCASNHCPPAPNGTHS